MRLPFRILKAKHSERLNLCIYWAIQVESGVEARLKCTHARLTTSAFTGRFRLSLGLRCASNAHMRASHSLKYVGQTDEATLEARLKSASRC